MVQKNNFDYTKANEELTDILQWFESGNADVDKALAKYKRAEELIAAIESYLGDVEKSLHITINKQT